MKNLKILSIFLGSLQIFIAAGAIPAGALFLADTSGARMGVTPEILGNSPLDSFLLPGLFLVLVNGLATGTAAVLTFKRHRYSGIAGLMLGIILCFWIIIQVKWITVSSFMQPMFFGIGVVETLLGWRIMKLTEQENLLRH